MAAYKTRYADVTTGAKYKNIVFSLTGRAYFSKEHDLSKYEEYNFNPADYDKIDYKKILSVTSNAPPLLSLTTTLATVMRFTMS
jgi:outer membrane receptor for ferrienterochelin and colicins